MRTVITVLTLVAGLTQVTAGADVVHSGGANFAFADGSVHLLRYGLEPGTATVRLEAHERGYRGTIEQGGRVVHEHRMFVLVDRTRSAGAKAPDCLEGWPRAWNGGRATIRDRGERAGELRLQHPREAGCALVAEIPVVTSGDPSPQRAAGGGSLQTPGAAPVLPGKGPGTGEPDQGLIAPPLPDLEIRKVAPAPGAPSSLAVTVRNRGVGPAAATQLRLYLPADGGKALAAKVPVPALAAGQSTKVEIGTGRQPIVEADLRIDDPNVIGESDELNNGFHYTAGK